MEGERGGGDKVGRGDKEEGGGGGGRWEGEEENGVGV